MSQTSLRPDSRSCSCSHHDHPATTSLHHIRPDRAQCFKAHRKPYWRGGGWLMCALPGCLADADHPAQAQSSSNNLRCCGTGLLPGTAGGDAGMPACSPPCWCALTAAACLPGSCSWASPLAAAGGGGCAPAAGVTAGGWSGSAELGIGAGGGCCTVAGAGGGCCTVAGAGGGCCTVAGAGGGCCTAAGAGGGCCTAAAGAAAGGCSRRVLGAAGEGGCSLG